MKRIFGKVNNGVHISLQRAERLDTRADRRAVRQALRQGWNDDLPQREVIRPVLRLQHEEYRQERRRNQLENESTPRLSAAA